MAKIHHTTDMTEHCIICDKPFKKNWFDAEEKNGRSEIMYGFEGSYKHRECIIMSTGRPPLGLHDLNEIEKRGISKEKFYQEHGYY